MRSEKYHFVNFSVKIMFSSLTWIRNFHLYPYLLDGSNNSILLHSSKYFSSTVAITSGRRSHCHLVLPRCSSSPFLILQEPNCTSQKGACCHSVNSFSTTKSISWSSNQQPPSRSTATSSSSNRQTRERPSSFTSIPLPCHPRALPHEQ